MILYRPENEPQAVRLLNQLKEAYDLRVIPEANWFLGIRIIRDRATHRLWLCQDSYIDKLAEKFKVITTGKAFPRTPLPLEPLVPYEGTATDAQILAYQQRIGSINFPTTISRPDIAKPCSILSQFLKNPSPQHIEAADRVIRYLAGTKYLAIEYSGSPDQGSLDFECYPLACYSDAAFADNIDRKSLDGFLFTLYRGPIDWNASKQATVTTSSIEAELLALSRTAKEV